MATGRFLQSRHTLRMFIHFSCLSFFLSILLSFFLWVRLCLCVCVFYSGEISVGERAKGQRNSFPRCCRFQVGGNTETPGETVSPVELGRSNSNSNSNNNSSSNSSSNNNTKKKMAGGGRGWENVKNETQRTAMTKISTSWNTFWKCNRCNHTLTHSHTHTPTHTHTHTRIKNIRHLSPFFSIFLSFLFRPGCLNLCLNLCFPPGPSSFCFIAAWQVIKTETKTNQKSRAFPAPNDPINQFFVVVVVVSFPWNRLDNYDAPQSTTNQSIRRKNNPPKCSNLEIDGAAFHREEDGGGGGRRRRRRRRKVAGRQNPINWIIETIDQMQLADSALWSLDETMGGDCK